MVDLKNRTFAYSTAMYILFVVPLCASTEVRYENIDCDVIGDEGISCSQCFDGGAKSVGENFTPDMTFSSEEKTRVIFEHENTDRFSFFSLNDQTTWVVSDDLVGYPSSWLWDTSSDGKLRYRLIDAESVVRMYATKVGKSIELSAVSEGFNHLGNYDAMLKFKIVARDFLGLGESSEAYTINSCVFYKAAR